jgi:hypothetical protein
VPYGSGAHDVAKHSRSRKPLKRGRVDDGLLEFVVAAAVAEYRQPESERYAATQRRSEQRWSELFQPRESDAAVIISKI